MNYILYKAISPSSRTYIGVTNNFKRRMKEHMSSKYAFGHALRKYGRHEFQYEFEFFDTVEEALNREAELVTLDSIKGKKLYNETVGGSLSCVLSGDNLVHREGYINPNAWTTENNPMNNTDSKKRMIKSQKCKSVSIDGIEYYGVREAARQLGESRQMVIHRLKSPSFPTWYYVNN